METWLERINNHRDDYSWLRANLDDVYDNVRSAVYRPQLLHKGTATLLNIYPFLLQADDVKRWIEVLFHAMLELMNLKDNEKLMRLWEKMGQSYTLVGEPRRAGAAFQSALDRAHEGNDQVMMLNAFIGLFKVQMFRQDDNFNDMLVNQAVVLARSLANMELQAELDYAIACAYIHRREFELGLEFAQESYAYWERHGNKQKMAQLIFNIAVIYRDDNKLEQANEYLELAKTLYLQTDDQRQYGLTAYEQGVLCRQQGEYPAAIEWHELALREFSQLKPPFYHLHYIGMTHEALGNALALDEQYTRAQTHLTESRKIWEQLDQVERLVGNYISIAYVMGHLGRIPYAKSCLVAATELCKTLPNNQARKRHETLIQESWVELNEASLSS